MFETAECHEHLAVIPVRTARMHRRHLAGSSMSHMTCPTNTNLR